MTIIVENARIISIIMLFTHNGARQFFDIFQTRRDYSE